MQLQLTCNIRSKNPSVAIPKPNYLELVITSRSPDVLAHSHLIITN